jgi:hypothetical protein
MKDKSHQVSCKAQWQGVHVEKHNCIDQIGQEVRFQGSLLQFKAVYGKKHQYPDASPNI